MNHQLERASGLYRCTVCLWTWTRKPSEIAVCPLVPRYHATSETFRTTTQWAKLKRQPREGEIRSGVFWSGFDYTALWTIEQTDPMPTPAPLTSEERAERRAKSKEHRTCQDCHKVRPMTAMYRYQLCSDCRCDRQEARDAIKQRAHADWLAEQVSLAGQWAADILRQPADSWAILDSETTDLDGAIIEIAVIDGASNVLLDTRLQPNMTISRGAQAIHHITDDELVGMPTFRDIYDQLADALRDRDLIIYNADFDSRRLAFECDRYSLPSIIPRSVQCAMERYAEWYGAWSEWHGSFTWQRLGGGHTALGDCLAVRERIVTMSRDAPAERISTEDIHPF